MNRRGGLRRKLWTAFALPAVLISLVAGLGVYGVSGALEQFLVERSLRKEAAYFWARRDREPSTSPPSTRNLSSYIVPRGPVGARSLSEPLRSLPEGFHVLAADPDDSMALVQEHGGERLLLRYRTPYLETLFFWLSSGVFGLMLAASYAIALLAYRACKRVVTPVVWLSQQVRGWDPDHPDIESIRPENLPVEVEGETLALATSLHEFGSRIRRFLERERDFTRDASHELRTPLAVVRVATDMMSGDASLSTLSRRSLARIQAASRDMEALIESFLILSREGDRGLPEEDFAVGDIVHDEVEKARSLLVGKPVELSLSREEDFGLHAPATVLSVLLGNLLRNACQHTDRGRVSVVVRRGSIVVNDTGGGMPPDFGGIGPLGSRRVRGGAGREEVGRGIGISIVRRLSERYGWSVRWESEAGGGTRAVIEFPAILASVGC